MGKQAALAGCLLTLSASALAHTPVCVCKQQDDGIVCEGGYSDGSHANGVRIDVIAYDETVLVSGQLDERSRFRFARPARPFYVLLDAGPGETAEVDWRDIPGMRLE